MSSNDKIGKSEESIEEAFDILEQQRDELRVKIHLAGMEVRDSWEHLEEQWEQLVARKDQLKRELEPTMEDGRVTWLMLKEEIVEGYQIIRDRL
jgi:hypothetical protein